MSSFARSYSQAFLGAVSADYDVDGFLSRAGAIRRALVENQNLRAFFVAPAVPAEAKKKTLEELTRRAGLDEFGRRFFRVLLEHRRLLELAPILATIHEDADRQRGVVEARVTVAAPLEETQKKEISQALARAVGRQVRLTTEVDEKILGGFIARVGSEVFDASVKNAIEQFQQQASEGAKV